MSTGDQSSGIEPFLDSEEMLLLRSIDPHWESHRAKQENALESIRDRDFSKKYRRGEVDTDDPIIPTTHNNVPSVNGIIPPGEISGEGDAEGGFAFGPLISSLVPLIGPAISGLVGLFKKKPAEPAPAPAPAPVQPTPAPRPYYDDYEDRRGYRRLPPRRKYYDDDYEDDEEYEDRRRARGDGAEGGRIWDAIKRSANADSGTIMNSGGYRRLLGMKGTGITPPNVIARGVRPANYRAMGGSGLSKWFEDHMDDIGHDDLLIKSYSGNKFYRQLLKAIHSWLKIAMLDFGADHKLANNVATAFINKGFPLSFQRMVKEKDGDDAEGGIRFGPLLHGRRDINGYPQSGKIEDLLKYKPMINWGIKRLVPSVDKSRIDELISQELGRLKEEDITGSGFFDRAKNVFKKIANAVLPLVAKVTKDELPTLINRVVQKFGIDPIKNKDLIDSLNRLAGDLSKKIPDKVGPVFEERDEEEDEYEPPPPRRIPGRPRPGPPRTRPAPPSPKPTPPRGYVIPKKEETGQRRNIKTSGGKKMSITKGGRASAFKVKTL